MNLRLPILLAAACLAACTVGPDYKAPKADLPADWTEAKAAAESLDLRLWWRKLNDPVLDQLIDSATRQNLDIKSAVSRLRQARAERGIANLVDTPSVSAGASYTRSGNAGTNQHGVNSHSLSLDASWELDIFGGARRGVEAADADIQAAIEDIRGVQVSLQAEVALDYLLLRGYQQQLAIARENIVIQKKSADITRKRQAGGFLTSLDVANADALVAATEAQIPALEAGARQTLYAIALLLGEQPGALVATLDPAAAVPAPPLDAPVSLPSELLRRRPDIRRAEAQLHGATARIGVATADLFPKFSITGAAGLQNAEAGKLVDWPSRFWSFGPSVSVPIFNRDAIKFNIEVQNALEEQARLGYQGSVLAALSEVESALVALRKEREHLDLLARSAQANRKAEEIATRLYNDGQTDYLNVVSAQRARLSAETALVQSRQALAGNWVALVKAMGGGWEEPRAEQAKK